MKVIAGLGNPETKYESSKHNIGYDFIDMWAANKTCPKAGLQLLESGISMPVVACEIGGEQVVLIKPSTGMNDSGTPVKEFLELFDLEAKDLILVYDDMAFELGTFRIKGPGGDGKHNGVKSVIAAVGKDFTRVRVGIGKPPSKEQGIDYVLSKFDDRNKVDTVLNNLIPAVEFLLLNGLDKAMNKFNGST